MTRAVTEVDAGHEPSKLLISCDEDIVRVRHTVRSLAVAARLSLVAQTKLVTATSELARNALVHGGGGYASVEHLRNGPRHGVRVLFVDSGPGIADLGQAMADGYTTGDGLGLGLGGARRLVDEFEIDTGPGKGTAVVVTTWGR